MKKLIAIITGILIVIALMFAEYRFIMVNIHPIVDNDTVYLELFGQIDEYDADHLVPIKDVNE